MTGPYREVLGRAFETLPTAVRVMHAGGELEATGRADVVRGCSAAARLAAVLFRLPPEGADQPLRVRFAPDGAGETCTRRFGAHVMRSRQRAGRGSRAGLLGETLGPLTVWSAPVVEGGRLRLELRRWRLFGLPLPRWLRPEVTAVEGEAGGRYVFDIAIAHRFTGPVVRYRGWLVPSEGARTCNRRSMA